MKIQPRLLSKSRFLAAACGGFAASVVLGAAHANAADSTPTVTFNVGAVSDYVFRGVSQTYEDPAIQGGIDFSSGAFYAGTWASNVDFGDSTSTEVDLYAGFKPKVGMATLDLGVIYYGYVNQPPHAGYPNWEFKAAGSMPAGMGSIGLAAYYSSDSFGAAYGALYYEVNGSFPVNDKLSFGGALGRQTYEGTGDYTTWNLGATWAVSPHVAIDFRYHDTDEHGFGKIYGSRAVVGVKATY